jgi:glycosyltransferase involved in cell wall biosynthesis
VISTIHNVYEGGWLRMLAYGLTDGLSRMSVAVSTAAAERYVRLRAVPQRKYRVICNGIDTVEFEGNLPRRVAMRERMGAHRQFIWLTAGGIAPAKDYPTLLRAFAKVRDSETEVQLWIAADATSADAAKMRTLAAQLGLNEGVHWLGLRHDIPALLDAVDGFVLGSAWEGMPLALGEAMAMEKPVVATDVGGVRELMGTRARSFRRKTQPRWLRRCWR